MDFSEDSFIEFKKFFANFKGISISEVDRMMDVSSPHLLIFKNSKYSHLIKDSKNNQPKILNKDGDGQYYATNTLIKELFDVSQSSADLMMKPADNSNISASNIHSELDRLKSMKLTPNFFNSRLKRRIRVEYLDRNKNRQVKEVNGVLMSSVLDKYYPYFQELERQSSSSGQSLIQDKKDDLQRFKKSLELNDSPSIIWRSKNGKNVFKSKKQSYLNSKNPVIDELLIMLKNEYEVSDQLLEKIHEIESSIAVMKNSKYGISFEQGPAYEDYKKWLKDNNKQEPEYSLLKQIAEHQKENKK